MINSNNFIIIKERGKRGAVNNLLFLLAAAENFFKVFLEFFQCILDLFEIFCKGGETV